MGNPVIKVLMKWLATVGDIITTQITNYVSSEEFEEQAKSMIKLVVEKLVAIVMQEKKGVAK